MLNILKISLFLIILYSIEAKYEIIFDRNESVLGDKEKMIDMGTSRMKKFNRSTAFLTGIFEVKIPIDNSLTVSFEAFNFDAGQYKKIFGRPLGPACDFFYEKTLKDEMKRFMSMTNISVPYGICPIPAGWIKVDNYTIQNIGDYLPPYIPGGERWKVLVYFSRDNEILGGITNYVVIRDNQKLFDSKFGK